MIERDRLTALRAGIQAIANYPRRDERVAADRPGWERIYHETRCLHAVAADVVLETGPDDLAILEHMLRRLSSPPDIERGFSPLRTKSELIANYQFARLALEALREAGLVAPDAWKLVVPEEFDEETFCALDERFEPMVRLQ